MDVSNPCRPGIAVRSLLSRFPGCVGSQKTPHKAGALAIRALLMKTRFREAETLASSHTVVKEAVLEFSSEGDADGDGDDGTCVGADAAASSADPVFRILMVGPGRMWGELLLLPTQVCPGSGAAGDCNMDLGRDRLV